MNFIITMYSRSQYISGSASSGLSIEQMSFLNTAIVSDQAIAGMLVISIPAIAAAIIKGGEVGMQAVAGLVAPPRDPEKIASSLAMGNMQMGWNHLDFPGIKPAQVWTMEGIAVDELLIYSGIKDGQMMHAEGAAGGKQQNFVFRSTMQTEAIVAMLEGVMSRDNSVFKLTRLEPYRFGGRQGFRFEYERIRKVDNVQLLGVGFGAVDRGELFALVYHAPRLTFFPRHRTQVEAMAKAAVIR